MNTLVRIGSPGGSVEVGSTTPQQNADIQNLVSLDARVPDSQAPIERSQGRAYRPQTRRQVDTRIPGQFNERPMSRDISRAYPSYRWDSSPSFRLSIGSGSGASAEITVGGKPGSRNASYGDNGRPLTRNIGSVGSDYDGTRPSTQAYSLESGTTTPAKSVGDAASSNNELQDLDINAVDGVLKAKSPDEVIAMVRGWATDGKSEISKEELTKINPALADAVFAEYPGDSIDVTKLGVYALSRRTSAKAAVSTPTTSPASSPSTTPVTPSTTTTQATNTPATPTTTGASNDTKTAEGNPTPTADELKKMDITAVDAMLKAQNTDETIKMVKGWATDGKSVITKEELTAINAPLADAVFAEYPGDSIDVAKLASYAINRKTAQTSSENGGKTTTPTTATPSTPTTPTTATPATPTTPTTPTAATPTTTTNQTTPTTETPATPTSNATAASSTEIDAKVAELLAKYAPKSAAKAKTHEALCKLAAKIAQKLTGDKKEEFLSAIETLGAPMGLNYGLSRTTSDGKKVPLNQKTAAQGGNSTTGTGAGADASNGAGNNTPTTTTPTTTANPTPTAEEFKTMRGTQLLEMLKAQSDQQTTDMVKVWSTDDGKTVTKAKLTELNPVMAKFAFDGVTGDSVEVEALTTKVLQLKEKAKAASAGTTTPTSTPQTGTGAGSTAVDDATFAKLPFADALKAIKSDTEVNTVARVKRASSDGKNISKTDLEKLNPELAARYAALQTNPSATVTIEKMAEDLNSAAARQLSSTTSGTTK